MTKSAKVYNLTDDGIIFWQCAQTLSWSWHFEKFCLPPLQKLSKIDKLGQNYQNTHCQGLNKWRCLYWLMEETVCSGSLLVTIRPFLPPIQVTHMRHWRSMNHRGALHLNWVTRFDETQIPSNDQVTRTSCPYLPAQPLSRSGQCQDSVSYCMNNREYIYVIFFRRNVLTIIWPGFLKLASFVGSKVRFHIFIFEGENIWYKMVDFSSNISYRLYVLSWTDKNSKEALQQLISWSTLVRYLNYFSR